MATLIGALISSLVGCWVLGEVHINAILFLWTLIFFLCTATRTRLETLPQAKSELASEGSRGVSLFGLNLRLLLQ